MQSKWHAVKSLSEDDSIMKEAVKGGTSVIMNRIDYIDMLENILNGESYYSKSTTNPEKNLQLKYKTN